MEIFYDKCSEEELIKMHDKAEAELRQALLDGADWEGLRYKTSLVTKFLLHYTRSKTLNGIQQALQISGYGQTQQLYYPF